MKVIYPHTNITCDIKDVKRRIKWDKKQKKKLKLEREKLSRRKEAEERSEKYFSYVSTEKDRYKTNINYNTTREFYKSSDWKRCRDEYLESRDQVCSCCGRRPDPNYKRVKPNPNRPIVLPFSSLEEIEVLGQFPMEVSWFIKAIFYNKERYALITYSATESAFIPVAGCT